MVGKMATTAEVHKVTVDIFGEKYTIRGDADPEQIVNVARLVDSRIRELASVSPDLPRNKLAMLAAINIADEMMQQKPESEPSYHEDPLLERRTMQLIELLDEGLSGDLEM